MKLLFDQNLSPSLVVRLKDVNHGSRHVRDVGLDRADDSTVWTYAAEHDLTIISKDADFHQRSLLFGYPPKVIWVRLGNCTTADIEDLLRRRASEVQAFLDNDEAAFLALG